jgi:hypothetical protein
MLCKPEVLVGGTVGICKQIDMVDLLNVDFDGLLSRYPKKFKEVSGYVIFC